MSLRTPWVLIEPGALEDGGRCRLEAEESRHLEKVLRRRPGDRIIVTDGCGVRSEALVREFGRSGALLEIEDYRRLPKEEGPEILLGILQGRAMDWALQKAVELGVGRVVPVMASRSQAAARAASRLKHWKRIGRQALKQCHRVWEMEISKPRTIEEISEDRSAPGFLADPGGRRLEDLEQGLAPRVLIGPEGGLDEAEHRLLMRAGWAPLLLGKHVLRAETAALVAAVLISHRFGF